MSLASVLLIGLGTGSAFGAATAVSLPAPRGPHAVGTMVVDLVDSEREEAWTEPAGDPRRLVVQIWYPAARDGSGSPAPYVPRAEALWPSLRSYWSDLPSVSIAARSGAAIEPGGGRLPLLVFSHGMNSARYFYTDLLQQLASRGYVVAAIDHSFWSIAAAFEDGEVVPFGRSMVARDRLSSDEIDQMMLEGIVVLAADQELVARRILSAGETGPDSPLAKIAARIDPGRIGALGHSMGGMGAQRSCRAFTRFRACASLDGALWHPAHVGLEPAASDKPLLLLLSEQHFALEPEMARFYLRQWHAASVRLLPGSRHISFTDLPLLDPSEVAGADPRVLHRRISETVASFFDSTLGAPQIGGRHATAGPVEGVTPIDLGALARPAAGRAHDTPADRAPLP